MRNGGVVAVLVLLAGCPESESEAVEEDLSEEAAAALLPELEATMQCWAVVRRGLRAETDEEGNHSFPEGRNLGRAWVDSGFAAISDCMFPWNDFNPAPEGGEHRCHEDKVELEFRNGAVLVRRGIIMYADGIEVPEDVDREARETYTRAAELMQGMGGGITPHPDVVRFPCGQRERTVTSVTTEGDRATVRYETTSTLSEGVSETWGLVQSAMPAAGTEEGRVEVARADDGRWVAD